MSSLGTKLSSPFPGVPWDSCLHANYSLISARTWEWLGSSQWAAWLLNPLCPDQPTGPAFSVSTPAAGISVHEKSLPCARKVSCSARKGSKESISTGSGPRWDFGISLITAALKSMSSVSVSYLDFCFPPGTGSFGTASLLALCDPPGKFPLADNLQSLWLLGLPSLQPSPTVRLLCHVGKARDARSH